ncbi:WD40-repeat-containing domain protein [Cantharellus anzutake]|uniref:WD40-repeat-containing domain protein n=1 Tax=Cantharellus anzutake TaxID=1750568 RepID=UPI001905961C|nr:WD40-repeat-containing domain protein [Cantharellus anzutake]KAF8339889.1 WD40-repeat-containing domain protein [Cantharellus anzutake]
MPLTVPLDGGIAQCVPLPIQNLENELSNKKKVLPTELEALAYELNLFDVALKSLPGFSHVPDYTAEDVDQSFISFQDDLLYWANNLKDFKGSFHLPSIRRHVGDLADEMVIHLEALTEALKVFFDIGLPTIKFAQKHTTDTLQNLSTVATFFSAVSATAVGFSYPSKYTIADKAVNLLWLISLVFSMASAVNSQLGYRWTLAVYSSPPSAVPWWISIWITKTPLVFLVASVVSFSLGLIFFTFANFSHSLFIPVCITVASAISAAALLIVSLWFAGDHYAFKRNKGSRWLMDELEEFVQASKFYSGWQWMSRHLGPAFGTIFNAFSRCTSLARGAMKAVQNVFTKPRQSSLLPVPYISTATEDLQQLESGTHQTHFDSSAEPSFQPLPLRSPSSTALLRDARAASAPPTSTTTASQISPVPRLFTVPVSPNTSPPSANVRKPGLKRFKNVGNMVVKQQRGEDAFDVALTNLSPDIAFPPHPTTADQPTPDSTPEAQAFSPFARPTRSFSHLDGEPSGPPRRVSPAIQRFRNAVNRVIEAIRSAKEDQMRRMESMVPALKSLALSHTMKEHTAIIRDIKFSPDGRFLASCAWDQSVVIWRVGPPIQRHYTLRLFGPDFASQLAWSPDNQYLVTKLARGYIIWNPLTGKKLRTVSRDQPVQSVVWMPQGQALVCTEGTFIYQISLDGNVLWSHNFECNLHDLVITPDESRLLVVGTLEVSTNHHLRPSRSRAEKRIILFDLFSRSVIHQMPTLSDVQGLSISTSGTVLLITHEGKTPPQLFRVNSTWLALLHTYRLPNPVEFAGTGQLGVLGPNSMPGGPKFEDRIIICAGKGGEFFIWDRKSSRLLHSFDAPIRKGSYLTKTAWNCGSSTALMVAGSSSDGTVRVWSSPWD